MLSTDFIARILGLFILSIVGARIGADVSASLNLPTESSSLLFGMTGALIGLFVTPSLTIRPIQAMNKSIRDMPTELLFSMFIGAEKELGGVLSIQFVKSITGAEA